MVTSNEPQFLQFIWAMTALCAPQTWGQTDVANLPLGTVLWIKYATKIESGRLPQGVLANDCSLTLGFLHAEFLWIFLPAPVEVDISPKTNNDKQNYKPLTFCKAVSAVQSGSIRTRFITGSPGRAFRQISLVRSSSSWQAKWMNG